MNGVTGVLDGTGNNTGIAWSLAPFLFFFFDFYLHGELGDKRDTRRGISVHEEEYEGAIAFMA